MSLIEHYRKLLYFSTLELRGELKGDNLRLMREYYAQVTISEVRGFVSLRNMKLLDVGGAEGIFCKVFNEEFDAEATNLDFQASAKNLCWLRTVRGVSNQLPFNNDEFDFVLCRAVLEHIPPERQQSSINEIYRVTKKDGVCYIAIPPWYNFFAGHQLRPFHLLPFKIARKLSLLFYKNSALNQATSYAELFLFPMTFKRAYNIITKSGFRVLATKDNHFRLHFLTKIPIIREIAIPQVAFIATK
jgi:ubiquinone/menaquinone biosynthesis C-methylase UbiE